MKINLKNFLYIPLIFFFLPAFAFWCPGLNGFYSLFYLVLYIFIFLLIIKDRMKFVVEIINLIHKTPLKYFMIVLFLMALNGLFLSLFNIAAFSKVCHAIILQIILGIVPIFLYFLYVIKVYIPYNKFIRFFLVLFWINLVLGFISYIGAYFNIEIINSLFDFFANARILNYTHKGIIAESSNYFAFGLPRLDNLHEEPSFYARFLYLFLPYVYSFGLSKVKLYNNKLVNHLIKRTIIPFTWISILLTFSPIYLIFCLLITLIYFYKKIFELIKKYFLLVSIIIACIILIFLNIDFSETYLSRIINVITQIKSFDDFILVEPSLATRVVNYINQFCIFIKHPFSGVGIGNMPLKIMNQYLQSPVTLTPEITRYIGYSIASNSKSMINVNANFFSWFLSENGIFIFGMIAYFYLKIFKLIDKLQKNAMNEYFDEVLLRALKCSFISMFIIMFYNFTLLARENSFLLTFAVITLFAIQRKLHFKEEIVSNESK